MRTIGTTAAALAIIALLGLGNAALAQPAPFNYPAAGGSGGSSSCSSDISTDCSTVLGVGHVTTGVLPAANGGTGQASAAAARGSAGLDIDELTGHGDSNYTILSTDRAVATNAAFTAARTWTLPAANAVNPGQTVKIVDAQGTVTGTNTLTIARSGTDTIEGGTSVVLSIANTGVTLVSDGVSKWTMPQSAWIGGTAVDASGNIIVGTTTTARSINFQQPATSQTVLLQQNGNSLMEYNDSNLHIVFDQSISPPANANSVSYPNGNSFGTNDCRTTNGCYVWNVNSAGGFSVAGEAFNYQFGSATYTITGSYATERTVQWLQPTITAASALSVSTEATNVAIVGAPIAAGSATIAKSIGLHVQAGSSLSSGATVGVGLKVDAPTGAGANKAAEYSGHVEYTGTAPTLSACGTSPSIAGNDMAGRVTVGTSPSTTCTLTFNAAFTNAPICFGQDETSAVTMRATSTSTTAVTFSASATMTAADKLSYRCEGYF